MTVAKEEPLSAMVLNETLSHLSQEEKAMVKDGFIHILTALTTAASLSTVFFRSLFSFLFSCLSYLCSPFLWLLRACWSVFLIRPLDLLFYLYSVFYPVIMFCLAAVGCGLFIGGCAGFASEALSTLLITTTWGPQPTSKQIPTEDEEEEEEPIRPRRQFEHRPSSSSSTTSIWDNKPFFSKKQGKEPLRPTRVEDWQESLSRPIQSRSASPPVLIRRMKMSSINKPKSSSWDWEDDDELLYTTNRKKNL
ncbi:hypothetical protein A0J61_04194 [Choanephora cucurbitarum]|uniref:Transmembrane protein n=1 Tax=Choanephora cucurbitarum TaxID=101091 RepID=A0A1C7NKD9_9FUNG|nr:hypothetical protein A0J61_04194 [Choanephora cucurbitarum]